MRNDPSAAVIGPALNHLGRPEPVGSDQPGWLSSAPTLMRPSLHQHYVTLHYATLHYTAIQYTAARYATLHYATLRCLTPRCATLQDPLRYCCTRQRSLYLPECPRNAKLFYSTLTTSIPHTTPRSGNWTSALSPDGTLRIRLVHCPGRRRGRWRVLLWERRHPSRSSGS